MGWGVTGGGGGGLCSSCVFEGGGGWGWVSCMQHFLASHYVHSRCFCKPFRFRIITSFSSFCFVQFLLSSLVFVHNV